MTHAIIRLEVEGMKHSVQVALSEYALQRDADIQKAIEHACSPANLARIIEDAARKAITECVADEMRRHFQYGPGRDAVREVIATTLSTLPSRHEAKMKGGEHE